MKTSKLGLVFLIAAGILAPPVVAADDEPDARQTNRYLGDRWNVRLLGNLTWYFTRHFGLGLGLAGSDVAYENTGGDSRIKVDLRQSSLTLSASVVF